MLLCVLEREAVKTLFIFFAQTVTTIGVACCTEGMRVLLVCIRLVGTEPVDFFSCAWVDVRCCQ